LLSATPGSQTVLAGGTTSYTATLSVTNGFTNTVMLGVSGVPAAASANFSPASLNGAGSASLNVTTSNNIVSGNYALTLIATSGTLTSTTTVALIVGGPANLRGNSTSSSVWDITNAHNC